MIYATGISLLSLLSDKSAVDVVGMVVGDLDVGCATGPFCSSCAIPPRPAVFSNSFFYF